MIHFPPSQAGRRGGPSAAGTAGRGGCLVPWPGPSPSWPAVSCGGCPAPRQALCSPARLGLFPDQPALSLKLGFSPLLPLCPVPPRARAARCRLVPPPACALPGILTPRSATAGSGESPVPSLAAAPAASCRLAAESPLPQEPAPISCPLALSPVINIGDGSAGSRHSSEAGPIPCLHLCTLLPSSPAASATLLCWVGRESGC